MVNTLFINVPFHAENHAENHAESFPYNSTY